MKKPDATTVISRENFKTIVWNLPVGEMIYIGRSSVSRLKKLNINTLGELANADRALLKQHFGIVGDKLIDAASGNEKEPVKFYYDVHIPKSVGHGHDDHERRRKFRAGENRRVRTVRNGCDKAQKIQSRRALRVGGTSEHVA